MVEKVINSIKFTAPVIKKDDEVDPEDQMRTQEELMSSKVAIAAFDVIGNSETGEVLHAKEVLVTEPVKSKAEENVIFEVVEQMPTFPGGMSALRAFVQLHVAQVLEDDASVARKRAYVQFRIKKDGTIDNIGLVRGDREAYHEAAKIVEQMPKWIPARRFGDLEDAHFVLAVDFNND